MREGQVKFDVGHPVEITREEACLLEEHGRVMASAARRRQKGWFLTYLTAHRSSHRIIREIFARSHAS